MDGQCVVIPHPSQGMATIEFGPYFFHLRYHFHHNITRDVRNRADTAPLTSRKAKQLAVESRPPPWIANLLRYYCIPHRGWPLPSWTHFASWLASLHRNWDCMWSPPWWYCTTSNSLTRMHGTKCIISTAAAFPTCPTIANEASSGVLPAAAAAAQPRA